MVEPSAILGSDPRLRFVRGGAVDQDGRCVVYWMQRSQRGEDNPAVDAAVRLGNALGQPVLAVFGLTADYPGAQRRHYRFLVQGLPETQAQLGARGVPLVVRLGRPDQVVARFVKDVKASAVIGDENPVRVGRLWRTSLERELNVPLAFVDGDVVVPSSLFPKEEYAARTLRPKVHKVWDDYLKPTRDVKAKVRPTPGSVPKGEPIDPDGLLASLKVGGASEIPSYRGGPAEAKRRLRRFVAERLRGYADGRNEPTPYRTSELSAHLHFGQISPLTIALAVAESGAPKEDVDAFLEELIVRRELAVNFVARNPDYDRLAGCPRWGLETLAKHGRDRRPFLYKPGEFEAGETHDPAWNAAQMEMVLTGRMHNYLRMYWAKKILEWTPDAESAFAIAVELNDRYEMDGRDPNGYAGIAWAVGGKHDRPWPERPIYGTVRTMTAGGLGRKLNVDAYIERVRRIERGQADGPDVPRPAKKSRRR